MKYIRNTTEEADMDIEQGDSIQTPLARGDIRTIKVLGVVGEAVLLEYPLNYFQSNRVTNAQEIYNWGCIVIKKTP